MKDLAGKTIAVAEPGDVTAFLPMIVLRKHGIPTDTIKFVGVGGHPTRLLAVTSGRADATLLNSRTTIVGQNAGSINVLANVSDELPLFGYVVLAVNENRLTDPVKRKGLQTFLEASVRGARFILENPEEAADILRERMPDTPRDELLSVIKDLNAAKVWGVDGGSDPEILRFSAKVSVEYGALRKEIDASQIVDDSLVKAVLERLGKAK
jgi:ABC-type nitrate/sulfonate/bicarbonate transport system substrate-binding protein